jgi:hypothetical protein
MANKLHILRIERKLSEIDMTARIATVGMILFNIFLGGFFKRSVLT